MQNLLLVFIGGGLGAVCRYISTTHIGALFGTYFPFGTLFVNTLGSLLMGFIMGSLIFLTEKTGLRLAEPARLLEHQPGQAGRHRCVLGTGRNARGQGKAGRRCECVALRSRRE